MDWIIQPRGSPGVMRTHTSFLTTAGNPSFCPMKGKHNVQNLGGRGRVYDSEGH